MGEKWWGLVDASVGREVLGEKWWGLVDASSKQVAGIDIFQEAEPLHKQMNNFSSSVWGLQAAEPYHKQMNNFSSG